MNNLNFYDAFDAMHRHRPVLSALIKGSEKYNSVQGKACFYKYKDGFWFTMDVTGLPVSSEQCPIPFFACHIHEGGSCEAGFESTMGHLNMEQCPHPAHIGDLLPLYAREGRASMIYFIEGIDLNLFKGRTLIIHRNHDDFTTQPSGNSGEKMACGVIE